MRLSWLAVWPSALTEIHEFSEARITSVSSGASFLTAARFLAGIGRFGSPFSSSVDGVAEVAPRVPGVCADPACGKPAELDCAAGADVVLVAACELCESRRHNTISS